MVEHKRSQQLTHTSPEIHENWLRFVNLSRASESAQGAAQVGHSRINENWLRFASLPAAIPTQSTPGENWLRFANFTPADIAQATRPTVSPIQSATGVLSLDTARTKAKPDLADKKRSHQQTHIPHRINENWLRFENFPRHSEPANPSAPTRSKLVELQPQPSQPLPEVSASRRALAGFFVSGLILSFPGAILPAWGYHLRPNYLTVGNYFLALVIGVLAAIKVSRYVIAQRGLGGTLVLGCSIAFASLLLLSLTSPPVEESWRFPGLLGLGLGAGLLNTAIFQALSPAFRINPAATVNLAGIFFGLGSFISPLLIAGTFNLYDVSTILYVVALVPGFFAIGYARVTFPTADSAPQRPVKEILREFTVPAAVLLSLLLFVHFGNEWAIAGWLPLFLILRLGLSPVNALLLLLLYWLALMLGRVACQAILPRFSHAKLLLISILASLLGCLFLSFTNNLFGATIGTLLVGLGFAPIYPLVVGAIRSRFPHYHPGFFNGIFSIGLTGGMLAPATVGYLADYMGLGAITLLPVAGSLVVLVLVLVIWLEAWFTRWHSAQTDHDRVT